VDPEWILAGGRRPANSLSDPLVTRFLRVNGESLAREWQSYQRNLLLLAPEVEVKEPVVSNTAESVATPIAAQPDTHRTGLPSWFTSYCASREGKKARAGRRRSIVADFKALDSSSRIAMERQDESSRQLSA
jgi:hypothetical protein